MEKIKRLILHIGTIKTGSSSIQASLGNARDILMRHNIYYPSLKPYNHIFSFPPIFMEDPATAFNFRKALKQSEDKYLKVQNYQKAWITEIEYCKNENFIISAEGFTQPYFTEDAVRRLKDFVEHYFNEVTIIAYVRHFDQLISSQMQQSVRNGSSTTDLKGLIDHFLSCPPGISYRKSLGKWANVFGRENLVVRPFNPQMFHKGSLLADFLHSCKLPIDTTLISEIRSNVSLGKHAVAFLQKYNQTYPLFINDSVNMQRGLAQIGTPGYLYRELVTDEKFKLALVFTPEQAQKFNEEIDFVNQFFEAGYQFPRVSPGIGNTKVPSADDIPIEFFVELINNYNKRMETLLNQNSSLLNQNSSLQNILDRFKVTPLMRIIDKFKLKQLIRKITNGSTDKQV